MPYIGHKTIERQKYFVENTIIPAIEKNKLQPKSLRLSQSKVISIIAFETAHSELALYRWLGRYEVKKVDEL